MAPPTPCLCETLRRATRAVTRAYDEALRPVGMRITQFSIVAHLAGAGESRLRDVSAALEMDETTVTRSMRILERKGWVAVRPGEDRRERLAAITPSGRRTFERAATRWRAAQDALREELGEPLWSSMLRTLPSVGRSLRE